jgi:pre-mRNA-splicing helicase BRR2
LEQWKSFSFFGGKKVCLLTGNQKKDFLLLEQSDLILSNPAHFDVVSRRWKARKGFGQIRLFIADEIQQIGEQGSVYEVVVSRMRFVSNQLENQIQILALGGCISDHRELAQWVGAS